MLPGDLVKQVRTPPVRSADGVVGWFYESFVPVKWHCWLEKEILRFLLSQGGAGYHSLLLRRKMSAVSPSPGRFSPGRKTPPSVSAPSAGLRPLSVSRVKCGGRTLSRPLSATMYGKYDMPSMDLKKIAEDFDIGQSEIRSGRDRVLPI